VAFSFTSMPKGFLPQEDQGYLFASVQLPEAASLERTEAVMAQARKLLMANPAVEDVIQVSGFNILNGTSASNGGFISVMLKAVATAGCGDGGYSAPAAVATGGDDHDLRAADPAGPGQCLGV
jgi:multidrug efflux pump subunit AcrB